MSAGEPGETADASLLCPPARGGLRRESVRCRETGPNRPLPVGRKRLVSNIIRRQRSTWTTVDNRIINDRRLSMKALGLLVFMLSKPDNWEFSQEALGDWFSEGRDAMRSVMKNLAAAGYIRREISRLPNGQLRTLTIVTEEPDTGFPTPAEPTPADPPGGQPVPLVKTDSVKTDPVKTEEVKASGPVLPQAPVGYQEILKSLVEEGVDAQHAVDWLKVRAKHKAPVTETSWRAMQREAQAAGITVAEAVKICAERGWRGFRADYMRGYGTKPATSKSIAGMDYEQGIGEDGRIL